MWGLVHVIAQAKIFVFGTYCVNGTCFDKFALIETKKSTFIY